MSADLFVVRKRPISEDELTAALASLCVRHEGVEVFQNVSVYFWHVRRVAVDLSHPHPDDDDPDEPLLLRPFVVVSSRWRLWPFTSFLAVALANALGGRTYDPQEGAFFDTRAAPDLEGLRAIHEQYLHEREPALFGSYWAEMPAPRDGDRAQLVAIVEAAASACREVLGRDEAARLGPEQVNWWQTFGEGTDAEIEVSSISNVGRAVNVAGLATIAGLPAFVAALEARLGVRFARVLEYEPTT